jgi:hypothetical protein
MPDSTTVRRVDKLFKTSRKGTGDPRIIHVEAQPHLPSAPSRY